MTDHKTDTTQPRFIDPIEKYWSVGVIVLGVIIAVSIATAMLRKGPVTLNNDPRALAEFELIERSGKPVSVEDLREQFLVVNFVFTSCSTVCMAVNYEMEAIQRMVADQPDVRLVSITVDPRTDTPEALRQFARRFNADDDQWLFLTGRKDEVYSLIETSFLERLPFNVLQDHFFFDQEDSIIVVDKQGRVRGQIDGMRTDASTAVLEVIEELRKEE